ncbi:gas vesicle protein [Actinomycetospora chibensis]|uniref:Gas vesicle protein n=1 Tax=Actinomycetospora chibensis TaxID=663606 RepID=A0ABV9RHY2_9PSEU|nr:gas vesicle protein [Actinomycetospora chibensis]MDD7922529.1 gas vesicle protein [Actinomycetospora chibensis]
MSDPVRWTGQMPSAPNQAGGRQPAAQGGGGDGTNLADILERVLDKGIVIAGDVQINLLDIELLTIKLRLIVASVDRAKEMGIDWWERDPTLSSGHSELEQENRRLKERLEALEGRNGQAALEGDEEPEDLEGVDDEADDEDELVDAEIVDDTEEPEPQPARRSKQTARQGGGGKAAPRRRRKAEE